VNTTDIFSLCSKRRFLSERRVAIADTTFIKASYYLCNTLHSNGIHRNILPNIDPQVYVLLHLYTVTKRWFLAY